MINPTPSNPTPASQQQRTLLDAAAQHLPTATVLHTAQRADGDENQKALVLAMPAGQKLETLDLEQFSTTPARVRAERTAQDMPSLLAYVARHHEPRTQVWASMDLEGPTPLVITAQMDDHFLAEPSWCEHRITYAPAPSAEWQMWAGRSGKNGKHMSQMDFAAFLEANISDIHAGEGLPSGGDMLKMALEFEAVQEMRLRSHVRLQNGGLSFEYVGTDDQATVKKMSVFDRFAIAIPVFRHGERFQITARLRYRNNPTGPVFWFELHRPDRALEEATKDALEALREGLPAGTPVFLGATG